MSNDRFACLIKLKDCNEWKFTTGTITSTIQDIERYGYSMNLYTFETEQEAKSGFKLALSRFGESVLAIKISKMNRYDLKKESEVLKYIEPKITIK